MRPDRLVDWIRTRPALHGVARGCVRLIPDVKWTRRIDGFGPLRFRLRQHRWFVWQELARNEHFMLGVFDRLIEPGDVVYDIGANIGIFTRMMVQWFGASRVVAVEPMSLNVGLLRDNVRLGGIEDRVDVLAMALGSEDGEEDLQIDDVRSTTAALSRVTGGAASSGRRHLDLPPRTERVRIARLDTLVAERRLPAPQVVKIDTEGAERLVLEGGRATLAAHRPRLAIATHGPEVASGTIADLAGLGYASFGFVAGGPGEVDYRRLEPADGARLADNNIVAATDPAALERPIEPRSPAECRRRAAAVG